MSNAKCECEEGLPEWIMSYADMITILMAFFVVMYSMAGSKDEAKEEQVMDSLRIWLGKYSKSELIDLKAKLAVIRPPEKPLKDVTPPKIGGKPTIESSRSLLFGVETHQLSAEHVGYLKSAAAAMAGKMHWVEIRGEPSRRPLPGNPDSEALQRLTYEKCRLVMDYLAAHGIEPSRIQTRVVPPYFSTNDELLRQGNDLVVDVYMLDQVYYPPGTVHDLPPDPEPKPAAAEPASPEAKASEEGHEEVGQAHDKSKDSHGKSHSAPAEAHKAESGKSDGHKKDKADSPKKTKKEKKKH